MRNPNDTLTRLHGYTPRRKTKIQKTRWHAGTPTAFDTPFRGYPCAVSRLRHLVIKKKCPFLLEFGKF